MPWSEFRALPTIERRILCEQLSDYLDEIKPRTLTGSARHDRREGL
jgi:hypothetical protein